MSQFIKSYLIAVPVFFLIDLVWLGLIAKNFYRNEIGFLMSENFNLIAALIFYLFYIIGIVVFAIIPALNEGSIIKAFLLGALLGAVAYATYDLTNFATLKNWPLKVVIVDIIWGTLLTGSVSMITYSLLKLIK